MEELSDWVHFTARENPSRASAEAVEAAMRNCVSNHRGQSAGQQLYVIAPKALMEYDETYNDPKDDSFSVAEDVSLIQDSPSIVESSAKDIEDQFMEACMKGDLNTIEDLLKSDCKNFDFQDSRGLTPLMHAIKNGHEELVKKLLTDPRIRKDDCLLAAVESGNYNITRYLLEYGISPNQEARTEVFDHGSTPLVIACIVNNIDLIKLLLEKNAEKLYMEPEIKGTTLHDCRKRIRLLQALSSPGYISLTCEDPVGTCFQLSKLAQWLANCEQELAEEYLEIADHCETLAAEFVNAVEDSFDIMTLLSIETNVETGGIGLGAPLCRLKEALDGQHKRFVAHSHCQLALADAFINGVKKWRHLDSSAKLRTTLLMVLCTPLWAIFCIILPPTHKWTVYLKIPFVKFLANIVIYFIILIIIISEQITVTSPTETVFRSPEFIHGSPLRWKEIVCSTWLLGQIVEEIKAMTRLGFGLYMANAWKMLDLFICIVFSIAFTARTMDVIGTSALTVYDRQKWRFLDPLLVYEASVCLGTLLAVNRILYYFRSHRLLGKLQMCLGASFGEITKFMALFVVMYLSFAAAINALYWKDQFTAVNACSKLGQEITNRTTEKCPQYLHKRYRQDEFQFQTIGGCLNQLYWTLFGYSDVVFASKVYRDWTLHTLVGSCLFIVFNFLAVVVLLNVLIGMITKVLDNIEDNIDVEWKFARSSIYAQFIGDSYCLPPPFNIIPSVSLIMWIFAKLYTLCLGDDKWVNIAKPYKLENLLRKQKQEAKLQEIMQSMKDQYLRNEMKVAEKEEVTLEDVESLRNDVSGLKFEILSYVRMVPTFLNDMTNRQHSILKELSTVKSKQDAHENQLNVHSAQLDTVHDRQMEKLTLLDQQQQTEFEKVKKENTMRIKEATDFQTRQAQENTQSAKERIVQAKDEQLQKVEMIYQKQEAYFMQLKVDQDNIMARQAIESQNYYQQFQNILNKLQRHEKRLDDLEANENKQFERLEKHNDNLIQQLFVKQEQKLTHLTNENHKLVLSSNQSGKDSKNQNKQLEATTQLQSEMNRKFAEEMNQLRNSYESRIEMMLATHQRLIESQNEFIKELLLEAQSKIMQCTKTESERIITTSNQNLPSLLSGDESAFGSNTSLNTSPYEHDSTRPRYSQIIGSRIPTLNSPKPMGAGISGRVGNLVNNFENHSSESGEALSPPDAGLPYMSASRKVGMSGIPAPRVNSRNSLDKGSARWSLTK